MNVEIENQQSEATKQMDLPQLTATGQTRLIPVTEWNRHHEWPPIGGLRHLAFFAKDNGFARAFLKVGRRLLVDESEFFRVIREKNQMHD